MAVDLLHQGEVWTIEIERNLVFSRIKWLPASVGGNLVCRATGAAHARFRPDASSTAKYNLGVQTAVKMAASMLLIADVDNAVVV